jgi:5'-3' exonuclease
MVYALLMENTTLKIHLIDGTYELFRNYFGPPKGLSPAGMEVGAVRGLCRTLLALITKEKATHIGIAFDHVIESFRNRLFEGYKTGEGMPEDLYKQFPLAERAAKAMGFVVWPMVEFEADDALCTAAARWANDERVSQVLICSPDKDLAQCVIQDRVVCVDRRRELLLNEDGVKEKFGVPPGLIPDYLALIGDTADGIPGIPKWGEKATVALLQRYGSLEGIPAKAWDIKIRGAEKLAESLQAHQREALLYRVLATLRRDVPLAETLEDLEWRGADQAALTQLCQELGEVQLLTRIPRWRAC